ncbi:hypothetical protein ABH941_005919 [Streptacidiphilus sp. EB103A]
MVGLTRAYGVVTAVSPAAAPHLMRGPPASSIVWQ